MKTPSGMCAAVDFGLTNTKVLLNNHGSVSRAMFPSHARITPQSLMAALSACGVELAECARVAVTGGQHRRLPASIQQTQILHVDEADAVGRGALRLARLAQALVASAGTGTAIVAARGDVCKHVFGTAVGGGTLLGLARLVLNVSDPRELDHLASMGHPAGADLTIVDAIGEKLNHLPEDMTAVNLGKVARGTQASREDLAASLMTLVAQTISLVVISTARAEDLRPILFVGHLLELASMRAACDRVAALYGAEFHYCVEGGWAGVHGALAALG